MHCTFCGLNGATMAFRSKSAPRALDELTHLATTYPGCDIQVVDNILDLKYFKTLLPELAARKLNVSLFYETKSNLKKEQVRLLRDSGVLTIQPGIESFSSKVLKLMKKGVSGLQNIQLLKWCKEIGVEPIWYFLMGFPGESPDDYFEMASLSARVCHLPKPSGVNVVRLDRFSPNFNQAGQLGFTQAAAAAVLRVPVRSPRSGALQPRLLFRLRLQGAAGRGALRRPAGEERARVDHDLEAFRARLGRRRRPAVPARHAAAGPGAGLGADRRGSRAVSGVRRDHRRQRARRHRAPSGCAPSPAAA